MGREDQSASFPEQLGYQFVYESESFWVELSIRFIQEDHLGVLKEQAGKC